MKNKTHILFVISVVWKSLAGLFETLVSLLLFSTGVFTELVVFLTKHELGQDPTDLIANKVIEFLPYLSASTVLFTAWYFLVHGIANITLAVGLLRKKLWSYPAAITVHIFFILYQIYRFSYTHAMTLLLLSFIDVIVIFLIWREYQFLSKYTHGQTPKLDTGLKQNYRLHSPS